MDDGCFQTFAEEKKALSRPAQRLNPVPASSAEKKQAAPPKNPIEIAAWPAQLVRQSQAEAPYSPCQLR